MANLKLVSLLFLLTLHNTAQSSTPSPTSFIKSSCKITHYPTLCIHSLLSYSTTILRSRRQLAKAALAVSLSEARAAAAFVAKLGKSGGAVRDCVENMGDSVDSLTQSVKEIAALGRRTDGGREFMWRMSNVQTWVSAALTDENTCLDGFEERRREGDVKAEIRSRITVVAQVTSNALAFVNRFATKASGADEFEP